MGLYTFDDGLKVAIKSVENHMAISRIKRFLEDENNAHLTLEGKIANYLMKVRADIEEYRGE